MITIRLDKIAKRLNKTISNIAEETGLNRNTVTALFHNKVKGIKFSTLEKICDFYNVDISDLLEIKQPKYKINFSNIYKQEGEIIPFTSWPWILNINLSDKHFSSNFIKTAVYFKRNYGYAYWLKDAMNKIARDVYEQYKFTNNFNALYQEYLIPAKNIEKFYLDKEKIFLKAETNNLDKLFTKLWKEYKKFWQLSLFIDAFDAGYDERKIKEIVKKYKFSKKERIVLTTPLEMTFSNERLFCLLNIIRKKKINKKNVDKFIKSKEIKGYIKRFDYYKSNYVYIKHLTEGETKKEVLHYLNNKKELEKKLEELKNYSKNQKNKIEMILKKHKLKTNPLYFFQKLTFWREHRKMINLMGIHILNDILKKIEDKTGIEIKYLKYLSPKEIDNVIKGLITKNELKKRYEKGIAVIAESNRYKIIQGQEANSLKEEFDKKVNRKKEKIISGNVASQGYAKGVAKIILSQKDFAKFRKGEILITSMTRPEYLPIIKKSIAIVTDEGGITCHAAIVSRELNKPCIIGTKNATKIIRNGDLIEVRAHHGTIRILKKK